MCLNVVELGLGLYGVKRANRSYFGTSIGAIGNTEARSHAGDLSVTVRTPSGWQVGLVEIDLVSKGFACCDTWTGRGT